MTDIISTFLILLTILNLFCLGSSTNDRSADDYCQNESFQPQCLKNEVILMKSATYGRMHVGRCLTAKEVEAQEKEWGKNPRYFGCSADLLAILDRRCSGKRECQVRVIDLPSEGETPCFPGLVSYLEASYLCVDVVDGERSCTVTASAVPLHIVGSSDGQKNCGTKSQPWNIEAPIGQKIKVHLIEFNVSQHDRVQTQTRRQCLSYGVIADRLAKRNSTICGRGTERETEVYVSSGYAVEIVLASESMRKSGTTEDSKMFLLRFEAVGCSDLIPPEDAWLKRSDDTIVIGCYSSRQSWHLRCEGEKWIGVFGNCSQGYEQVVESENEIAESQGYDQVLTLVAAGGFTLTVCLAVLCTGIICYRRFSYKKGNKSDDYRTLNYQFSSAPSQNIVHQNQTGSSGNASSSVAADDIRGFATMTQPMPTYSVYVGEGDFNESANQNNQFYRS